MTIRQQINVIYDPRVKKKSSSPTSSSSSSSEPLLIGTEWAEKAPGPLSLNVSIIFEGASPNYESAFEELQVESISARTRQSHINEHQPIERNKSQVFPRIILTYR